MFWRKKKCCVDAGKSECSLIEELRQLQKEIKPVQYKYPDLKIRHYYADDFIFGSIVKYTDTEEEKIKQLEKALENEKYNMEVNKKLEEKKERIKELKKELGIT